MRKVIVLGALALLCTVLVAGAQAGKQATVVKLKFATYVWQPTTVAANKQIVESWNKAHPGIQVEIVPVDVNSVHDKLLTSFVGGTAADVIHDEAADIAGFTQQGYLANLTPLLPKTLKQSIPKDLWATTNFGGKITGVPSLLQTYNVFANMDIFKAAGIKAPTLSDPWTWAEFRSIAKRLTTSSRYGVCWGLRSPTAVVQTMSLNYGGQFFYLEERQVAVRVRPEGPERRPADARHDPRRQVGRPGRDGPLRQRRAARLLRRQVRDDGGRQLHGAGHDPAEPEGLQLGDVPAAEGRHAAAGGESADVLDLGAEQEQAVGDVLPRLPRQQAEPGQARARRLADPVEPGGGQAGAQVDRSGPAAGRIATESVVHFRKGNWVSLADYPRWKAEVAQPAFVQYLRGSISLQELGKQLNDGWTRIRG